MKQYRRESKEAGGLKGRMQEMGKAREAGDNRGTEQKEEEEETKEARGTEVKKQERQETTEEPMPQNPKFRQQ